MHVGVHLFIPQLSAANSPGVLHISSCDSNQNDGGWRWFILRCKTVQQCGVDGYGCRAFYPQCLINTRYEEDESNARIVYQISQRIYPVVASSVRDGNRIVINDAEGFSGIVTSRGTIYSTFRVGA